MENQVQPQGKKRYEKPLLTSVRLMPEVATLGACKGLSGTPAPHQIDCYIMLCANLSTS